MSAADRGSGTPLGRGDVPLSRAELGGRVLAHLQKGGPLAPDVLLVEVPGARVVVKDWAPRRWLVRSTLGRLSVVRELRAHRRLEGHPAVPRLLGRLDGLALVLEHRPGSRFSIRRADALRPGFGAELEAAVLEMHRRGVVHLDLSHRSNLRVDAEGRPVLVDFGAAVAFRPGGLPARLLLPALAHVDRRALRKWRRHLARAVAAQPAEGGVSVGPSRGRGTTSEGARGASRPT